MLSTTYNTLFAQAVDTFCVNMIMQRGESGYDEKFTLFYPLVGKDFRLTRIFWEGRKNRRPFILRAFGDFWLTS